MKARLNPRRQHPVDGPQAAGEFLSALAAKREGERGWGVASRRQRCPAGRPEGDTDHEKTASFDHLGPAISLENKIPKKED